MIGTGDLSELALGWATYNGDHMSMYGMNAGIPKTLVSHLVRYYADTVQEKEPQLHACLMDVLDTPVSPELLPPTDNGTISQRTEDLVGPYELHDYFLYYMLRCGYRPRKIYRLALQSFEGVYDRETILGWERTFMRRFFAQQFKRSCLPDGPKVGSVAVSPRGICGCPVMQVLLFGARIWRIYKCCCNLPKWKAAEMITFISTDLRSSFRKKKNLELSGSFRGNISVSAVTESSLSTLLHLRILKCRCTTRTGPAGKCAETGSGAWASMFMTTV